MFTLFLCVKGVKMKTSVVEIITKKYVDYDEVSIYMQREGYGTYVDEANQDIPEKSDEGSKKWMLCHHIKCWDFMPHGKTLKDRAEVASGLSKRHFLFVFRYKGEVIKNQMIEPGEWLR